MGGIAFVLAGALVWRDTAGVAVFLARTWEGVGRSLTPQELRLNPRRVRLVRYETAGLLTIVGVLMLWKGFTQG